MKIFRVLTLAALVCACGGGSDPTGPAIATIAVTASGSGDLASIGDTRTVTAVAKDASQNTVATPALTWTSSAPTVAAVSGTGASATVTALGNGSATITASSGSVQGTTSVTVAQKFVSATLSSVAALAPGATAQLVANARDARQVAILNATGFTFASADPSKAIVSASGVVTGIAPGSSAITATLTRDAVTSSANSTVTVAFGTTSPTSATVNANTSSQFDPGNVLIGPGGTVQWSFGSQEHNVGFAGVAGAPGNIGNSVNSQVSRSFTTAGTFNYSCSLHAGMSGVVTVRASTAPTYATLLGGAAERPNPVTTNGAGSATFTVNGQTVSYVVTFSGLTGPPVMSHIHGPGSAAVAVGVLVDFPTAGVTANAGVLSGTFTAGDIRGQGGQPAISIDSLFKLMGNGNAYVNVHTTQFPGGEIRGQLATPP